jgi:hypothetical protein
MTRTQKLGILNGIHEDVFVYKKRSYKSGNGVATR